MSKDLPTQLDYDNTENCTGDGDIYCDYADVFGCRGKEDHDAEKADRKRTGEPSAMRGRAR